MFLRQQNGSNANATVSELRGLTVFKRQFQRNVIRMIYSTGCAYAKGSGRSKSRLPHPFYSLLRKYCGFISLTIVMRMSSEL